MQFIRFVADDGRILLGEDLGNHSARLWIDTSGVLTRGEQTSILDTLAGKRALVADDDANMRELIQAVLSKAGCTCTVCKDGLEAIDAIGREKLDLVVSDILMPGHTGYEIFSAAKHQRSDLPVVLVTGFGYDPSHSLVRAAKEGQQSVLYKPFTPQQLIAELNRAISTNNGSPIPGLIPTTATARVAKLLPPIVATDIFCVGRNYLRVGETRGDPGELELFMKPTSSLLAPDEPIRVPDFADHADMQVDCEGELAVIIGSESREVDEEHALNIVLGYTIANDVTARRFQTPEGPPQWMRGKGFDTFCPIGPGIIPASDKINPNALSLRTLINGVVTREGNTAQMIRSVQTLISQLSRQLTLKPGMVLLTGSPPRRSGPGVPESVRSGDEVAVEIEGLGVLRNMVATARRAGANTQIRR